MPPAVAPALHPERQNLSGPQPPPAAAPMANPHHIGVGSAPPPAADTSAGPPPRRAPRLAKRRHAATSSRSRPQQPSPAVPWNPFSGGGTGGNDGLRSGESGGVDGGSGLGKDQSGGFVFGATPGLSQQPQQQPSSDETPFVFGSVRDSLPRFDEGWSAAPKLHDKMGKLNLRSPGKGGVGVSKVVAQKDGSSIFGADTASLVSNSEVNTLPEKLTQLNIGRGSPLQNDSAKGVPKTFLFRSNEAAGFADSRNTANCGADSNSYAFSSVHGTEANNMSEKLAQLSIGDQTPSGRMESGGTNVAQAVFMFGSNTRSSCPDSNNGVTSGPDTNLSSTGNSPDDASVLPEKISQLDIGSGMPFQHMKSGGVGMHHAEVFVFGNDSDRREGTLFGKATNDTSCKWTDFFSASNSNSFRSANGVDNLPAVRTPDLNVGSGFTENMKSDNANFPPEALVFGKNESTTSVLGQSASTVMDDGGNFVTASNTTVCTSADVTMESTLPEKMTYLNLGCGIPSHRMKDETATRPPEVFVFGSNVASRFSSAQTASMPSNVSSEPEVIRNSTCSRSNNDKGYGSADFVFGSSNNATTQSSGAAEHKIQDEIKKLNINCEVPSVGCNKMGDSCTPEFLFQSKAESTSGNGNIPLPKVDKSGLFTPLDNSSSFSTSENATSSFSSRTMNAGVEIAPGESCAVKQDPSRCSRESLFGIDYIKSAYRDKKEAHKNTRRKKRPTRLKQCPQLHQAVQETCSTGLGLDSAGDYSPMDCSPYPNVVEQTSRETSVNSDLSVHTCVGNVSNLNSSCAEDLVSATEHLVINADLPTHEEGRFSNIDGSEDNFASSFSSFDEANLCQPSFADVDPKTCTTEACVNVSGFSIDKQTCEENTHRTPHKSGEPVTFQSSSASLNGLNFLFGVSLSTQSSLSTQRRRTRRKIRTKGSHMSKPSATQAPVQLKTSQDTESVQAPPETSKAQDSTTDTSISVALEICETWRTSGNQAYANGHFATAEEYYTRAINYVSHLRTSGCCSRALTLCYSNRAATRMSLGRTREALQDCLIATSFDPTFLKAKVRAANCQLALGNLEDASRGYTACLKSNNTVGSESKFFAEASDGLERVKRVADWMSQSKELLKKRTLPEATRALELISNAMKISSQSDCLVEMKAEVLLVLRRYEEVIQLCQETIDSAKVNSVLLNANGEARNSSVSEKTECPGRLWRSFLICKSYFLLGKLEEALDMLKKHEQLPPAKESYGHTTQEEFSSLSTTIKQLLTLKAAGNESFQARQFSEAVEKYSAALACNSDSRPFSAVCFCNRAAAYQSLGQVTDAIADCSLAMVLDANYPKAISRRATLYEMIRDYGQAANDLSKLISLLEKQANNSGASPKILNKHSDLKQARARLLSVEEEAKNDTPLNLYLILGVEPSCSQADIKKAYRKAALRHHPDKAAQFLVRNENADDGFWRDVAKEVYADADHLFKTIGEAYNVLSCPDKRQEYDIEESLRNNTRRVHKGRSKYRSPEQHYRKQYDRGFSPRQWQSYSGASTSRWSRYSDDYW